MMPKLQGTEVCRLLRAESIVPIIMLTAKDAEIDRVLGLELGADDYITKPFSTRELVEPDPRRPAPPRPRALGVTVAGVVHAGDVTVDLASHRVSVAGREVRLTPSEFKVLALLVTRAEPGLQPLADHGAPLGGDLRGHGARRRRPHLEPPPQARGEARPAAPHRHRPRGRLQARARSERAWTGGAAA